MRAQRDSAILDDSCRVGGRLTEQDSVRWRADVRLCKYLGKWSPDDISKGLVEPYEVLDIPGNLLMAQGAINLWAAAATGTIANGLLSAANATIAVADGNPTATAANCTFTNGSATVTCANTAGPLVGDQIRLNSDGNWYKITAITANTSFTISTNYAGVTGTGAAAYVHGETVGDTDLSATQSASLGGGITGVTNANPAVFTTSTAHGLIPGQQVVIASVGGATGANGTWVVNTVPTTSTFSIVMTAPGVYTSGGTVKLQNAYRLVVDSTPVRSVAVGGAITNVSNVVNPTITTTTAHGLAVGHIVTISTVVGATGVNATLAVASVPSSTTFTVTLPTAPGVYSSGGITTLVNILRCVATFQPANANHAWNEWGLTNSAGVQSGSDLWNRKVIYLGAKSGAATWQFQITLGLS